MSNLPVHIFVMLCSLMAMELIATLIHRYVMHGIGWAWHKSHHRPRTGRWEKNDLYAVVMTLLTTGLFYLSGGPHHTLWWVALGVTFYGLLYTLFHDGLVHHRFPFRMRKRPRWIKRLDQAHHLHHMTMSKEGAVSFGFLYAPPPDRLRAKLKAMRRDVR